MPMTMAIEHSGIAITTDSLKTKLLDMESDFKSLIKGKMTKKGGRNDSKDKKNIQCYACKKFGHYKTRCPNIKKPKNDKKVTTRLESHLALLF